MELPKDKKAQLNKWVYRIKHEDASFPRQFKARLVVKGYNQKKGIDYDEIFSPVVNMSSIWVFLDWQQALI